MPLSTTRAVAVGWLVVLALLALFVFLGLLRFLVFLLFMRLVVDLLVHGLGNRVPFLSRQVVLYGVYALVAGVIAVLTAVVVPRFLVDLPEYVRSLDANLGGKIAGQLASWNIAIDVGDLKLKAVEWGRGHLGQSFDLAKRVGTNVVLLMVAFVITFIITHERITRARSGAPGAEPEDLWRFLSAFMRQKIGSFYGFFRLVMAGQVVISLINTGLTLGLLVVLGIPHKAALTVMVFVFGLLPIIGNLISNTLICLSAFLWAGLVQLIAALAFLIVIHKLEYFLNGKIIGNIVKLPVYMTLLGLIVGEALFGISGMILSIPTILFVRAELGAIKVAPTGSGERV
jgi:predicted PurR-regulated permease PerM